MTRVGLSLSTSARSSDQQSPSFGRPFTGATSAHHFVTPASHFFAPTAHKIEVALGASETILRAAALFPSPSARGSLDCWRRRCNLSGLHHLDPDPVGVTPEVDPGQVGVTHKMMFFLDRSGLLVYYVAIRHVVRRPLAAFTPIPSGRSPIKTIYALLASHRTRPAHPSQSRRAASPRLFHPQRCPGDERRAGYAQHRHPLRRAAPLAPGWLDRPLRRKSRLARPPSLSPYSRRAPESTIGSHPPDASHPARRSAPCSG